jgi:hypothetical protein
VASVTKLKKTYRFSHHERLRGLVVSSCGRWLQAVFSCVERSDANGRATYRGRVRERLRRPRIVRQRFFELSETRDSGFEFQL